MAHFQGDFGEFNRYIGPFIRNRIQQLTRPLKNRLDGKCERCRKDQGALEAAHQRHTDRPTVMRQALAAHTEDDQISVDLAEATDAILDAHKPLNRTFFFLCRSCHTSYDRGEFNMEPHA